MLYDPQRLGAGQGRPLDHPLAGRRTAIVNLEPLAAARPPSEPPAPESPEPQAPGSPPAEQPAKPRLTIPIVGDPDAQAPRRRFAQRGRD